MRKADEAPSTSAAFSSMHGASRRSAVVAKPIHMQRLERLLDLNGFEDARRAEKLLPTCTSSDEESDQIIVDDNSTSPNNSDIMADCCDGKYFVQGVQDLERSWLSNICAEELPSAVIESNDQISTMLELHQAHKRIKRRTRHNKKKLEENMYYGSGLIANYDKYPDHKKAVQAKYPRKKPDEIKHRDGHDYTQHEVTAFGSMPVPPPMPLAAFAGAPRKGRGAANATITSATAPCAAMPASALTTAAERKKQFKDDETKRKYEESVTVKRRRLLTAIYKKEIGKQQRTKVNRHKEALISVKKLALQCQKVIRQKAILSQRACKELPWRMKRLTRENQAYWRRSKRLDREKRRKQERAAEEQRKMDHELTEVRRQQRKLNFLITQTELYAHFMSRKVGKEVCGEEARILRQLEEGETGTVKLPGDDYNCEAMKAKAVRNAQDAFQSERSRTMQFNVERSSMMASGEVLDSAGDGDFPQPAIFTGTLKAYQLRGMNWLASLYDQGISGILADEMGLGKTVQSIAFLCHLAEYQDLWGPFLVICPASTLHNWQQEFEKFVPDFKVVPYWGNPSDRKILRQFWFQDGMHTRDSSYHAVVTSYQIVISDVKYFNRVKWEYMVLDEAQAIKSTSSMRWKTLLGFNCRNRLLLSGTPIQNSMAELWALLHFIMPTLFDSHEEFNEWFSKDIESHAENKTGIDEKHLSRLHMILKPFMLRRIKKDVENELSDKIEVMVYCPLTSRQRLMYMALKQKIRIEDLLHYTVGGGGDAHSVDKNFTSNLMNLVMQFRKVCNHPELFERRDAKSPISLISCVYIIPRLIYDYNPRIKKIRTILKHVSFTPQYVQRCMVNDDETSLFKVLLALRMSVAEFNDIMYGPNVYSRWRSHNLITAYSSLVSYMSSLNAPCQSVPQLLLSPFMNRLSDTALLDLVFARDNVGCRVRYAFLDHKFQSMPETLEHREMRHGRLKEKLVAKDANVPAQDAVAPVQEVKIKLEIEIPYIERKPVTRRCQPTEMPSFLFCPLSKTVTLPPSLYCLSRRAAHDWARHLDDYSWQSMHRHWLHSTDNAPITPLLPIRRYSVPPPPPVPTSQTMISKLFEPAVRWPAISVLRPIHGWSYITVPDKESLVNDSGKLSVLDGLLKRLKEGGHRVLIYSQMTKMIDLLEEYMCHRQHKYMRLDGSSKISERRDMVADFQAHSDYFVFLLSTRAGGLGINLTAADTVIFYDSDWNPTVDQQAMDRAHRLGQTKQVTVYRLICKGSIEERILQRAREKSEIQKLVISGGNFKPDTLKPKEVVSLLLDDEEIELKYRQRAEERKHVEDMREQERKRKYANNIVKTEAVTSASNGATPCTPPMFTSSTIALTPPSSNSTTSSPQVSSSKRVRMIDTVFDNNLVVDDPLQSYLVDSSPTSPTQSDHSVADNDGNDAVGLDVEAIDPPSSYLFANRPSNFNIYNSGALKLRTPARGSSKRGRPRGSKRISALGRFNINMGPSGSTASPDRAEQSPSASDQSALLTNDPESQNPRSPASSSSPTSVGSFYMSSMSQTTSPCGGNMRRGPGRPRLKPGGPANHGIRGTYRPRKPVRPLPVPLPTDSPSPSTASTSQYLFPMRYMEQSD